MHRIFAEQKDIFKSFQINNKKELHHAVNVLRLKINDKILAFDGKGNEILGSIQEISKEAITINPEAAVKKSEENLFSISLACALPKRAKFDFIIEKATELGVATIIPLITQRTEVHLSKERQVAKLKHWHNISVSAAKQSQRTTIPKITEVKTFKEVLKSLKGFDLALLPCLSGNRRPLKEILAEKRPKKILVFIGPEGDFTANEVDLAIRAGANLVTLGKTVLRVDTAAIFVISAINSLLQ